VYKILILIVVIGFSFFGLIDVHAQEVKLAKNILDLTLLGLPSVQPL